ncbi:MAG: hypothetical protein J6B85_09265 [Lachnospiraceae bacterium]|nr:hypothetical protein [Lachnospiraceae bacterium]
MGENFESAVDGAGRGRNGGRMSATFLHHDRPLLTTMIQTEETQKAIKTIHKAIEEGTDAFGLQTCRLKPEYRTEAVYRSIFAEMQDKPVYVINYRLGSNEGKSDDELARGMITLANAGATLIDVMGDLFCKTPGELTTDAAAVEKQKRLIDTLHELGAEVPYLFLSGGECHLHRMIGPMLGCCMYLCVQEHDELSTKSQPLLHKVKAVLDHF